MSGKKIFMPRVNVIIPYIWAIGVLIFSSGLMWGGLKGEPRRTNLGLTYLNPDHTLFNPDWVAPTTVTLLGGIIMFVAGMLFVVVFFGTMVRKKVGEGVLVLPESEAYHDERRIPLFDRFKPWLIAMGVIILIAYVPAIYDAVTNSGPKAPAFTPENPVPVSMTIKK